MALARRRGVDEDEDETFKGGEEEEISSYISPGMVKKMEHPGGWHNREEALGGWVGGGGLFGNAVKLFENVGDAVSNIVAPLPEDDESFGLEDSFEQRYGVGQQHGGGGDDSREEYAAEEKQKVEDDAATKEVKVEQLKSVVSPPPPSGGPVLPLSAPAVDPKFLLNREGASDATVSLPERHNLLNESVEYLGNVSIDLDNTPEKGAAIRTEGTGTHESEEPLPALGQSPISKPAAKAGAGLMTGATTDTHDRELLLHEKYRQGMEERLAQSEGALSKKDQELRTVKEQLARSVDEVKRCGEQHGREIVELQRKLRVAEETIEERSKALQRVSNMGGVNSEQSDSFRKAMEEQDREIMKLQGYLQESEDRLKEHEELTWAAKAEQSELIFALDCEKKATEKAVGAKEALQGETEALKQELHSLRVALDAAGAGGGKGQQEGEERKEGRTEGHEDRDGDSTCEDSGSGSDGKSVIVPPQAGGASFEQQQVRRLELQLATLREDLCAAIAAAKLAEDGLLIERNDKDDAVESTARAEKELRASQGEVEGLNVVIAQLRNAKRSQSEQFDGMDTENKELREKVNKLQQAWTRDTQQLSKVSRQAEEEGSEKGRLRSALHASQGSVEELEDALAEIRGKVGSLEKENYELTVHSDVLQSDNRLQEQELGQRTTEVSNLHAALAQLQREKEVQASRLAEEAAAARDDEEEERQQALDNARRLWQQEMGGLRDELSEATKRVEDEGLLRRKAQLDLANEKKAMQRSLEGALAQLRNGQSEVVDRTLIANLVVQYFQKGYRKEILILISKVLQFDQDQMVSVGLAVPRLNLVKSLVDGLKRVAAAPADQVDPESLEGDNLAELWVSFLNAEAGIEEVIEDGGKGEGGAESANKSRTSSFSVEGIEGGATSSTSATKSPRVPARSRPVPSISSSPAPAAN